VPAGTFGSRATITGNGQAATIFQTLSSSQSLLPDTVARDLSSDICDLSVHDSAYIRIITEPYTVRPNPEILRTSDIDTRISSVASRTESSATAHSRLLAELGLLQELDNAHLHQTVDFSRAASLATQFFDREDIRPPALSHRA